MSVVKNLKTKLTLDQNLITIALLCLIIILGAALRFHDLGAENYSFDEVIMVPRAGGAQGGVRSVFVLLAHFWIQVFGTTEAATRSLSALVGIASIPVMYIVGRELFGRKVGLLSALLMTISEFQIFYSQDLRYYPLFVLMTLFSFLFYIRALKSRRLSYFALYVLASILLYYTHLHGVFVFVAQILYFLLQWNRYRKARVPWLVCQSLILLVIGPSLLPMVTRTSAAGSAGLLGWLHAPPPWEPLETVLRYVFPARYGRSWVSVLISLAPGTVFLLIGTWLFATWKGKERRLASVRGLGTALQELSGTANELVLVGCWLLCPIVLPFVLSYVIGPMYIHRYTISAAPALYLLLALGIIAIREVVPELISLAVLVVLIAPGLHHYYVTDIKEQWREAAAYVQENARKDDVIVFAPAHGDGARRAFYWYYRGNLPACDVSAVPGDGEAIADFLPCISDSERFWLIVFADTLPGREGRFTAFFLNRHHEAMHLIRQQEFTGISVYLFELRKR